MVDEYPRGVCLPQIRWLVHSIPNESRLSFTILAFSEFIYSSFSIQNQIKSPMYLGNSITPMAAGDWHSLRQPKKPGILNFILLKNTG